MKKVLALFLFVFFCCACVYAQNAQVTFGSTTNFSIVEDGFHPVKFQLTEGSNANVEGLLQYVQNNPKYFKVQVDGNELTLNFVEGVHWGVWMKVFGAMEVSQIEIREANQNIVVDPRGFLDHFNLLTTH